MNEGFHHFHVRKRIHQKLEPYPSPDKLKRFIDNIIYIVAAFGILVTVPQFTNVWINRNAIGVSPLSWAGYSITAAFWAWYGVLHKEKAIVTINLIWVFINLAIAVGALIYGH